MNFADELEIDVLHELHMARKKSNAASMDSESDHSIDPRKPYVDLILQLQDFQSRIPGIIARVDALRTHKHEYGCLDYCIHCGLDGNA